MVSTLLSCHQNTAEVTRNQALSHCESMAVWKEKEKTTPFGVNTMRRPVLDRAAQAQQYGIGSKLVLPQHMPAAVQRKELTKSWTDA